MINKNNNKNMFVRNPQNMQCILQSSDNRGELYIGSIAAAVNYEQLDEFGITAVVSILSRTDVQLPNHIQQFFIQAFDSESEQLYDYFESAGQFIHEALQSNQNVLIHCYAGQSRSATIVVAYLMKYYKLGLWESLQKVQNARKIARPNPGFMSQLEKYSQFLDGRQSNYMKQSCQIWRKKEIFSSHLQNQLKGQWAETKIKQDDL